MPRIVLARLMCNGLAVATMSLRSREDLSFSIQEPLRVRKRLRHGNRLFDKNVSFLDKAFGAHCCDGIGPKWKTKSYPFAGAWHCAYVLNQFCFSTTCLLPSLFLPLYVLSEVSVCL